MYICSSRTCFGLSEARGKVAGFMVRDKVRPPLGPTRFRVDMHLPHEADCRDRTSEKLQLKSKDSHGLQNTGLYPKMKGPKAVILHIVGVQAYAACRLAESSPHKPFHIPGAEVHT